MSEGPWDYDGPDPNKPEEWNTSDGTGVPRTAPDPGAFGGPNGEPVPPDPNAPAGNGGPYGQATANDHKPADAFGGAADAGADATDASADVNVAGSNNVANNAAAEAAEIAAVPDPQSPAGQAAILAIIEKYQGKSAGTVQTSAATEQAHGSHAADSNDRDDDHSGSGDGMGGGGTSLMDILSSLLGSGGSSMQGMNPFGQQGMPMGQGMGGSPFGDPYAQQAGATPAANPFADPLRRIGRRASHPSRQLQGRSRPVRLHPIQRDSHRHHRRQHHLGRPLRHHHRRGQQRRQGQHRRRENRRQRR